jgi:hypothetical protein
MDACGNCHTYFDGPPAAVVTPSLRTDAIGLGGRFCSWNCAKRRLIGLRNRPWFTLMAITAIKSGAKLPIRPSETGKPPTLKNKEVVQKIPDIKIYSLHPSLHCPSPFQTSKVVPEEDEPEAFSP